MQRLPRLTNAEIFRAQQCMDYLSRTEYFKPGEIKRASTQSYTKALTAKFMMARSRHFADDSFMVGSCESYDAARGRSSDLFGFLDLIAANEMHTIGVQACGADWQPHIAKMRDECFSEVERWLAGGRTLEMWGWVPRDRVLKSGARGSRKVWVPRVQRITVRFLQGREEPEWIDPFEGIVFDGGEVAA